MKKSKIKFTIDYFGEINKSIEFAWKYKKLWLFGFILAMFGGTGSGSGGGSSEGPSATFDSSSKFNATETSSSISDFQVDNFFNGSGDKFSEIVSSPLFWVAIGVFVLLVIIFTLVAWYLTLMSRSALMIATKYELENKANLIGVRNLWKVSWETFLTLFLYDFLSTIVVILLLIVLILIMAIFSLIPILGFCMILFGLVFLICFIWFLVVYNEVQYRAIVLNKLGLVESVKYSFTVIKNYPVNFVLSSLALFLTQIVYYVIAFILTIVLLLIIMGIPTFLLITFDGALWTIILAVTSAILFLISLLIVKAPYEVYVNNFWSRIFIQIDEQSRSKKK